MLGSQENGAIFFHQECTAIRRHMAIMRGIVKGHTLVHQNRTDDSDDGPIFFAIFLATKALSLSNSAQKSSGL